MLAAAIDAQRQVAGERDIEEPLEIPVEIAEGDRVLGSAGGTHDFAGKVVEFRGSGNDSDRARLRARAIERSLRSAQHLDPLHVVERHCKEYRGLAEVGRYRAHALAGDLGDTLSATGAVRSQSAQRQIVHAAAGARSGIDGHQAGNDAREVVYGRRAGLGDLRRIDDADVVGNALSRLLTALRRDDDLLENGRRGRSIGNAEWTLYDCAQRAEQYGIDRSEGADRPAFAKDGAHGALQVSVHRRIVAFLHGSSP